MHALQDLDYVGVDDSEELEQDTGDACTCLMYLNPTDTAKHLMHEWRHVCIVTNGNNQPAWNAVSARSDTPTSMHACLGRSTSTVRVSFFGTPLAAVRGRVAEQHSLHVARCSPGSGAGR